MPTVTYEFATYKEFLNAALERKLISRQGMCKAAQIQPPYLSRVLIRDAHLNSQQLYLICEALNLSSQEQDYLQLLLEHERANHFRYKQHVGSQIARIRKENLKLKNRFRGNQVEVQNVDDSSAPMIAYYLEPQQQVVHMALTIPKMGSNLPKLAKNMNITIPQLEIILSQLQKVGLVDYQNSHWISKKPYLHLDQDHVLSKQNHVNWRLEAIRLAKSTPEDRRYSYSASICANHEFYAQLVQEIRNLVAKMTDAVTTAESQNVFQLNIDLMEVV